MVQTPEQQIMNKNAKMYSSNTFGLYQETNSRTIKIALLSLPLIKEFAVQITLIQTQHYIFQLSFDQGVSNILTGLCSCEIFTCYLMFKLKILYKVVFTGQMIKQNDLNKYFFIKVDFNYYQTILPNDIT